MVPPRKSRRVSTSALSDTFVARRHQLRLTQSDLALLAGVGRSTVQSIEGGRSRFSSTVRQRWPMHSDVHSNWSPNPVQTFHP